MNESARSVPLISAVVLAACIGAAGWTGRIPQRDQMTSAAAGFLESLELEQRERTAIAFDSEAREDWHYVPRKGSGIAFKDMTATQRMAARNLMRSTLSSAGMNKVEEIMLLDDVLRELEQGKGPQRDALAYSITIFGTPGKGAWGWKLEGHHVSLNFTGVGGQMAVTPSFLGANPAEVRAGDRAGVRVLAAEEDIARELLGSFTAEQRRETVISSRAPADILAVPGRSLDEIDSVGLAVGGMDTSQRAMVERLLHEYAHRLRRELATVELDRIRAAGIENIRFAWMGGDQQGEGHYYRLTGPTFVIEYDNTQNGANHVHTVWRDRERDFGRDLLKEHHEHDHAHP